MSSNRGISPENQWQADEADRARADTGYVRYIAGVAILHDPFRMQTITGRDPSKQEQRTDITVHAKTLIYTGLGDIIRSANTPDDRRSRKGVEGAFKKAIPHMEATRDRVIEAQGEKLEGLLPDVTIFKPLPVLVRNAYNQVAHPRKEKLFVADVMAVWNVNPVFGPDIWGEDFRNVPVGHDPISGINLRVA